MRKDARAACPVKEPDLLEKDRYHRVVLLIVYEPEARFSLLNGERTVVRL